ncbi:hypothetical protein BGZ54_008386 [Gamsiella multidivaricata]|nr:hypothetical protein BGZ54_008386 [Gamsiella multidivaricata]
MSALPPPPPPLPPATEGGAPPSAASTHSTVYVGHLSARTERRDVEELFEKYGRLVSVELKHGGFAFVEYEDPRDADDAVSKLNGYELDGNKISVEWSRRSGGPGSGCFLCNQTGHWARECPEAREKGMDVKSGKCFKCGEPGHLARFCRAVPPTVISVADLLLLPATADVVALLYPMVETPMNMGIVDEATPDRLSVGMEGPVVDTASARLIAQVVTVVARLLRTIVNPDVVAPLAHMGKPQTLFVTMSAFY